MHIGIVENDSAFRDELILRLKKAKPRPKISFWQSAENYLEKAPDVDVLLLDIMLPGMTGIELAKIISERGFDIKIIMLTNMNSDALIFEAIQNGAMGYVLKSELNELDAIIKVVAEGGAILTPTIALRVINALRSNNKKPDYGLSPRQKEILDLMVSGKTIAAVAKQLELSPHTVHGHVKDIYKKLNVHNRAELVAKVLKNQ